MNEPALAALARRLGGVLVGHHPLVGGVSARVEALELLLPTGARQRVVFRQHGAAAWKPLATEVTRREHALLGWLRARGMPVPAALLLDVSRALLPAPFLVMELVEGRVAQTLSPAALRQLASFLARLHALAIDDALELPDREDPVAGLSEYSAVHAAIAEVIARAPRLTPRRVVLHGDFWPGNVLWRGEQLAAVIDWEDAAIGDPLSDLACCRLELAYRHAPEQVSAFTARYLSLRGLDQARSSGELALWDAYVSAATLASLALWGLEPEEEALRRARATSSLDDACRRLLA